ASRILIDGDCFRTESPEATYEGIFTINVEAQPQEIDIDFVAGPEAGDRKFGLFCLDNDHLELCLGVNRKGRPAAVRNSPGSGHGYERVMRDSHARPEQVTGGTPPARQSPPAAEDGAGFEFVACATLTRLQGDWTTVKIVRDGQELPAAMLATGLRSATHN